MTLQTIYKKTKTEAIQQYDVQAVDDKVLVTQGQVDGLKQTYTTTCTSKNAGKSNETTPAEQARAEACAKHARKIKSGYVTDPSGELTVLLPQKVKPYIGNEHKVTADAYSTPKLNGINGTYWLKETDALSLTSRGGDEYPAIPHLEDEIRDAMKILDTTCLNGELYIHGEHLQDITSAVKKPKELSKRLTFYIFDAPYLEGTYAERIHKLAELYGKYKNVFFVDVVKVADAAAIEQHYEASMAEGYEGTVIYNADAPYEFNIRSSHVYKYKKTLDGEYQVSHYDVDKNGHPVFLCHTEEGSPFKVKPKGTAAERLQMIEDFEVLYKDQWYKIEYETLSKDGVPLKGVGIGLRDCNTDGEPIV